MPLDGDPAIGRFSVAYVRDADVREQVEAWAAANGYAVSSESSPRPGHLLAETSDGLRSVSVWRLDESDLARELRITELDLEPTDHVVQHRTVVPEG